MPTCRLCFGFGAKPELSLRFVDRGLAVATLAGHRDAVNNPRFNDDGSRVVTASSDNTARVWRQGADDAWAATALQGHTDWVGGTQSL